MQKKKDNNLVKIKMKETGKVFYYTSIGRAMIEVGYGNTTINYHLNRNNKFETEEFVLTIEEGSEVKYKDINNEIN